MSPIEIRKRIKAEFDTLAAFAQHVGIHKAELSQIIHGKIPNPKRNTLAFRTIQELGKIGIKQSDLPVREETA